MVIQKSMHGTVYVAHDWLNLSYRNMDLNVEQLFALSIDLILKPLMHMVTDICDRILENLPSTHK